MKRQRRKFYIQRILLIILVVVPFTIFSQNKRNIQWIIGNNLNQSTGTIIHISGDSLTYEIITGDMPMYIANTSISDVNGNLLFFSNGCDIKNEELQIIENGDQISPGWAEEFSCEIGSPFEESIYIIPSGLQNQFNVYQLNFHIAERDSLFQRRFRSTSLTKSIIDQTILNGKGGLIKKNEVILEAELSNNGFQAIRHENGKDWWLIAPEYNSNCYYIILISDHDPIIYKQCLGRVWKLIDTAGQSTSSRDGRTYVRYQIRNGLHIFRFDPCDGILSKAKYISLLPDTVGIGGAALSPSGRFLYATNLSELFQFDLSADSIGQSKLLIDTFDGTRNPQNANFDRGLLAPNDKIYFTSRFVTANLHVVEQPDSLGLACQFKQRGIELPFPTESSMASFPTYTISAPDTSCFFIPFFADQAVHQICFGEQFGSISLSPQNGQAPYSYQWSDGPNVDSIRTNLPPDLYTCSITDATGRTLIKQIDLHELAELTAESDITNANSGQANGVIRLSPSGGLPPYSFTWSIENQTDSVVTDLPAGNYAYTITDTNGCTFEGEATIDQLTTVATVFEAYQFSIYPNPTQANVQVEMTTSEAGIWSMALFSSLGRKVDAWKGKGNKRFIIEKLSAGVYWLVLKGEGWSETRRVVVLK